MPQATFEGSSFTAAGGTRPGRAAKPVIHRATAAGGTPQPYRNNTMRRNIRFL